MEQEALRSRLPELPWLLYLGLLVWSIAVIAHIVHHALSISRGKGLLYTLGYLLISWTVSGWLQPIG